MKTFLIGASSDLGLTIDGARFGPSQILSNLNLPYKDFKPPQNYQKDKASSLRKNEEEINKYNQKLFTYILRNINDKNVPITIGGDHSLAIASALASATYHQNIGIIWVDTHPDYNTFNTTITGNIHGLPLAVINNLETALSSFTTYYIKPENTVIIGARDIDKLELLNLKKMGIKIFTTKDIKKYGPDIIVNEALKIATANTKGIHVSFDLDVIDPLIAPGVSVKKSNGLNLKEALKINELLLKSKKVLSYDLVEFNPLNDFQDKTLNIATKLLKQVLDNLKD